MRRLISLAACATLIALVITGVTPRNLFADPDDSYKKHAGYVDFDAIKALQNMDAKVEVFLKGPLLAMAREVMVDEEPDMAEALAGVVLIRVKVYDMDTGTRDEDRARRDEVSGRARALAGELEKKGWDMTVRVREDDEDVYVYLLPSKTNKIDGLCVMAVDRDEAVFVNIVGTIDPENIGRLGHSVHIRGFDALEDAYPVKEDRHKRSSRED